MFAKGGTDSRWLQDDTPSFGVIATTTLGYTAATANNRDRNNLLVHNTQHINMANGYVSGRILNDKYT